MTTESLILLAAPILTAILVSLMLGKCLRIYDRDRKAPHCFPWFIPILKSTIPFVFNGRKFFHDASLYCQGQWPLRVDVVNDEFYLVQGAKNITAVLGRPGLTVTRAYGIVLKYCFGMEDAAVDVYVSDTSGSRENAIPGSHVPDHRRVSYHTHKNLVEGLLGPGFVEIAERIEGMLYKELSEAIPVSNEWIYGKDLTEFFEDHVGTAVLMGLYGPLLVKQNPTFNRTLWKYDKEVMALAKRFPNWLIPKAYRFRDQLIDVIFKWHQEADYLSESTPISGNQRLGDAHPYWGSVMMRERYQMLLGIDGQTAQSVASTDLAFIWATITNVVPSTMTLCSHMFSDSALSNEIRTSVADSIRPTSDLKFNIGSLEKIPILLSMYAETLRFGVQIHIPRCSPHQGIDIGGSRIPANKLILINTELAHNDASVWNTGGRHPLSTFWPRRFILDSTDPTSGPLRNSQSHSIPKDSSGVERGAMNKGSERGTLKFTMEGLEGSFIPFGGGLHACPGRLLAKRIMVMTCAMMATMFDLEILDVEKLEFDAPRFGFGVRKPSLKVPYRIRRRL